MIVGGRGPRAPSWIHDYLSVTMNPRVRGMQHIIQLLFLNLSLWVAQFAIDLTLCQHDLLLILFIDLEFVRV
jgi:hypothetical protein